MALTSLNFNLQYQKFLWYFSKGDYVNTLNVLYDGKGEIQIINDKLSDLMFSCMEALCLFMLSHKDSFYTCMSDILNKDNTYYSSLSGEQAEFVCVILLISAFQKVIDDVEDTNKLSQETIDFCNKVNEKYNLIPDSNTFSNAELLKSVYTKMVAKVNKINMINDIEAIYGIINSYINYLSSLLYKYQYGVYQ